jgi:hypothetical protein
VWDLFYVTLKMCVSCDTETGRWCSMKLYYLDVTLLIINKAFPYQKKIVFFDKIVGLS